MLMTARSYVLYIHRFKRTGKRDDIFLATKFGFTFNTPGRIINGSPAYVKESLEKSLKRLGVAFVDLFYLHRPDKTIPIEVRILVGTSQHLPRLIPILHSTLLVLWPIWSSKY